MMTGPLPQPTPTSLGSSLPSPGQPQPLLLPLPPDSRSQLLPALLLCLLLHSHPPPAVVQHNWKVPQRQLLAMEMRKQRRTGGMGQAQVVGCLRRVQQHPPLLRLLLLGWRRRSLQQHSRLLRKRRACVSRMACDPPVFELGAVACIN